MGHHEVTTNRNFLDSSLARDLCRTSLSTQSNKGKFPPVQDSLQLHSRLQHQTWEGSRWGQPEQKGVRTDKEKGIPGHTNIDFHELAQKPVSTCWYKFCYSFFGNPVYRPWSEHQLPLGTKHTWPRHAVLFREGFRLHFNLQFGQTTGRETAPRELSKIWFNAGQMRPNGCNNGWIRRSTPTLVACGGKKRRTVLYNMWDFQDTSINIHYQMPGNEQDWLRYTL